MPLLTSEGCMRNKKGKGKVIPDQRIQFLKSRICTKAYYKLNYLPVLVWAEWRIAFVWTISWLSSPKRRRWFELHSGTRRDQSMWHPAATPFPQCPIYVKGIQLQTHYFVYIGKWVKENEINWFILK